MTEAQARVVANALVFGYFAALEQWYLDGGDHPIATYVEEGLRPLRTIWPPPPATDDLRVGHAEPRERRPTTCSRLRWDPRVAARTVTGEGFHVRRRFAGRPAHRADPVLAPARRRPGAVRRVPAGLPAARGPARAVLRPGPRPTTRSCSPPTAGRAGSASTRSRRSRSTTSCRARAVLSFGTAGCNLACKFCQNWDISKSREIDTLADAAAPEALAAAAEASSVRAASPSPTTIRRSSWSTPSTSPTPATSAGIQAIAVTAGYICPEPRRGVLPPHGRRQRRPQGVHRGLLPPGLRRRIWRRCWTRSNTCVHETGVWVEITTLLIPGRNDSDAEIDAETRWIAEHLGPDVPLHFTAFHPDYKMRDVPPTPPATLTPGPAHRARQRPALRLHRQRPRRGRRHHLLPVLRRRRWSCGTGTPSARYRLTDDGRCGSCGAAVAGVYSGPCGSWGRAGCRCR